MAPVDTNAAIALATIIIAASIVAVFVLVNRRRRQAEEDDLKQAASSRGWTLQSTTENGYYVTRWTGATDGVAWIAESLRQTPGGNKRRHRARHISRWHGTFSPGVQGTIICMGIPKGKEPLAAGGVQGEGFLVQLAQKAAEFAFDKAIDMYFGDPGKDIDAGAMHRVEPQTVPGFVVMASDKEEGARIMSQGLERTLLDATNDQSSVLAEENRPWILIRPNAIAMARMELQRNASDVERFTKAGVALTRAFRFSRRVAAD